MIADEKDTGTTRGDVADGGSSSGDAGPTRQQSAEPGRETVRPADGEPSPHVSNALRTAYQATVQEDVPAEFLDLLGKLA